MFAVAETLLRRSKRCSGATFDLATEMSSVLYILGLRWRGRQPKRVVLAANAVFEGGATYADC